MNKSPWKIIKTWSFIIILVSWGLAGVMVDEGNRVVGVLFYIIVSVVGLIFFDYLQKKSSNTRNAKNGIGNICQK